MLSKGYYIEGEGGGGSIKRSEVNCIVQKLQEYTKFGDKTKSANEEAIRARVKKGTNGRTATY